MAPDLASPRDRDLVRTNSPLCSTRMILVWGGLKISLSTSVM